MRRRLRPPKDLSAALSDADDADAFVPFRLLKTYKDFAIHWSTRPGWTSEETANLLCGFPPGQPVMPVEDGHSDAVRDLVDLVKSSLGRSSR